MDDGVLFGGTALLRHSFLTGGVTLDAGGGERESSVVRAALLAGLAWQTELGLRFDLLGSFGIDAYHAQRRRSFLALDPTEDPGASAAIACAGARAGVWYRFAPRGTGHLIVGAFASYEQDLDHVTDRYSYYERSFLDTGAGQLVESERRFGDRRLAVALTVGLVFDLLPVLRRPAPAPP